MHLAYYKLREEPFRLTPDPRFLHLAEPHHNGLKTLVEGIVQRKGILLLTGPIGAGKTTILHATMKLLLTRAFVDVPLMSAFLVNPTLAKEELLEAILTEFAVEAKTTSKPARLAVLHRMLLDTSKKGGTAVLFVDEAHLLPADLLEELRLLNNMDTYAGKLLQIVLCGQPELQTLLARPEARALQQRVAARCYLRPLTRPETSAYISERLQAAGLTGPSPFDEAALDAIFQWSQAIPRLINLVSHGALAIGAARNMPLIGAAVVDEVAASLDLTEPTDSPGKPHMVSPAAIAEYANLPKTAMDLLIEILKRQQRHGGRFEPVL
jgi:general secretion pathway protein A